MFQETCLLYCHPEWMKLCEQILGWTFENQRDASHRSNLVAQLLSELMRRTAPLPKLRGVLDGEIRKFREASLEPTEDLEVLLKLLRGVAVIPEELAAIFARIKSQSHVLEFSHIEIGLLKVIQTENEIREQLSKFVRNSRDAGAIKTMMSRFGL